MFSPYQSIITPTHKSPAVSPVTTTGLDSILAKTELFSSSQYLHWLCSRAVLNHHQHYYLLCCIRQVVLMVI